MGASPGASPVESRPSQVEFLTSKIAPPAHVYLDKEDRLFLLAFSTATNETIRLNIRILRPDGSILSTQKDYRMGNPFVQFTATESLNEGFLLSVVASATGLSDTRGQTYVAAYIFRGVTTTSVQLSNASFQLLGDYVTLRTAAAWPGGRIFHPTEGAGLIRSIPGTDPAAGVEISETVPTFARWRLLGIQATLVTAGLGGVRPELVIDDGGQIIARYASAHVMGAGETVIVSWNTWAANELSVATIDSTRPISQHAILLPTFRIRTVTQNLHAGDNWGPPQLWVEQWFNL